MKSFLRENPTIAFGLGLPLLLVIAFMLISGVPSLLVAPPQYDVLYATGNHNLRNGVQISVVEEKVQVLHRGYVNNNSYRNETPRIWRYNPKTGAVKEIVISLPPSPARAKGNSSNAEATEEALQITEIDVPDLAGLRINSFSIAPDGYEFRASSNRSSGNVFGGLFYSNRYNYEAELTKKGRNIRLPNTVGHYYNSNTQFIGWVVSP